MNLKYISYCVPITHQNIHEMNTTDLCDHIIAEIDIVLCIKCVGRAWYDGLKVTRVVQAVLSLARMWWLGYDTEHRVVVIIQVLQCGVNKSDRDWSRRRDWKEVEGYLEKNIYIISLMSIVTTNGCK